MTQWWSHEVGRACKEELLIQKAEDFSLHRRLHDFKTMALFSILDDKSEADSGAIIEKYFSLLYPAAAGVIEPDESQRAMLYQRVILRGHEMAMSAKEIAASKGKRLGDPGVRKKLHKKLREVGGSKFGAPVAVGESLGTISFVRHAIESVNVITRFDTGGRTGVFRLWFDVSDTLGHELMSHWTYNSVVGLPWPVAWDWADDTSIDECIDVCEEITSRVVAVSRRVSEFRHMAADTV